LLHALSGACEVVRPRRPPAPATPDWRLGGNQGNGPRPGLHPHILRVHLLTAYEPPDRQNARRQSWTRSCAHGHRGRRLHDQAPFTRREPRRVRSRVPPPWARRFSPVAGAPTVGVMGWNRIRTISALASNYVELRAPADCCVIRVRTTGPERG